MLVRSPLSLLTRPIGLVLLCAALVRASAPPADVPEWLTVRDRSLEIASGSPLDLSALAGGLSGDAPLMVAGDHFTLGGRVPRINCTMLGPGFSPTLESGFPDHNAADRYAVQLRRHGYNLVRFHHIDSLLMQGARQDFRFDPTQVDRFNYLMAALKKQGIRWSLDLMTSDNGAIGGIFPNRWSQRLGLKMRLYVEPTAFRHWQTLATKLLTSVNPYTGIAPAQDPATAMVVLLNEGSLTAQAVIANKATRRFPDFLKAPFAAWLTAHGRDPLAAMPLPSFGDSGDALQLMEQFLSDRQVTVTREMVETVRATGYSGLYTAFDSWPQLNQVPSRRSLPLIDMHGYDQVPPGGIPGARVRSQTSLDNAARYLTTMDGARFLDRPFIVTEHDQPFWNSYRYEAGLVAPALASLQGWQFMCLHADGPIDLSYDGVGVRKNAIQPDGGGLDPVARAGETLKALLLLRGEIVPARATVGLTLSDAEALTDGGWRELSTGVAAIAWVARLGLIDTGLNPYRDVTAPATTRNAATIVDKLRAKKLLDPTTDQSIGTWVPAGGQVTLIGSQRQLRVVTPRTAAIVFEQLNVPVTIGPVQIAAASAPGLIAFSALDAQPLAASARILVMMASDARNSGMQVAADGTLKALGKLPVQLRRIRATATLATETRHGWRLTPLRLNGDLDAPTPLTATMTGVQVPLDTAAARGPTTFFLLERR